MATPHAVPIILTDEERAYLEKLIRQQTAPQRDVGRARIVLLAADGLTNQQIARATGVTRGTVAQWRSRFAGQRCVGLQDRPRSGRPPVFSPSTAASAGRASL